MSQLLIDGAMPDAASLAGILANLQAQVANITNVTGTIGLNQVAYGSGTNTIVGNNDFKHVTSGFQIGATPFVFKDTAGVLQLGDTNGNLRWSAANNALLLGDGTSVTWAADAGGANPAAGFDYSTGNKFWELFDVNGTVFEFYDSTSATPGAFITTLATGDIGVSGAPWRTGYFGTSVVSPLFSVASGAGNSGITTTITTASLVGKTITVQGGIITGFA